MQGMVGLEDILGYGGNTEDVITYCLYVLPTSVMNNKSHRWVNTDIAAALDVLPETVDRVRELIAECAKKLTEGYIWNYDSFWLRTNVPTTLPHSPPHLTGLTRVKGNLEDQWYIVAILVRLSQEFPNLVISVNTNDGQLLLIEADDPAMTTPDKQLPMWVHNPKTHKHVKNRVFIHRGDVLLIPPVSHITPNISHYYMNALINGNSFPKNKSQESTRITAAQALQLIVSIPHPFLVNKWVTEAVHKKIFGYIDRGVSHHYTMHTCKCYIPSSIVKCLEGCPQLVAEAVRGICDTTLSSTRWTQQMIRFNPTKEKPVLCNVTFTRILFAQFKSREFHPPRCFSGIFQATNSTEQLRSMYGIKLTCGFEVAYQQALHNATTRHTPTQYESEDEESMQDANKPVLNLEGERLYLHKVVDEILENFGNSEGEIEQILSGQPPEDSEEWLHLKPEEMDKMLETKLAGLDSHSVDKDVTRFLNKQSDFEGIELEEDDFGLGSTDDDSLSGEGVPFGHDIDDDSDFEDDGEEMWASLARRGDPTIDHSKIPATSSRTRSGKQASLPTAENDEIPIEMWNEVLPHLEKLQGKTVQRMTNLPSLNDLDFNEPSSSSTSTPMTNDAGRAPLSSGDSLVVNLMESLTSPGGGAFGPAATLLQNINLSSSNGSTKK